MPDPNSTVVDNPYSYLRSAQEYERAGDFNGADISYKAAIMAADRLPLAEYGTDFRKELHKYKTVPGYQTQPGVGLQELTDGYSELLSLPFKARLLFANFLLQSNSLQDAYEMIHSAFEISIDSAVADRPMCSELIDRAQQVLIQIENQMKGGKPKQKDSQGLSSSLLSKPKKSETMEMQRSTGTHPKFGIDEMWKSHTVQRQKASQNLLVPGPQSEPMNCEARKLVDSMFACLREFVQSTASIRSFHDLQIVVSEPAMTDETLRRTNNLGQAFSEAVRFYRFRASTQLLSLSVRATESMVQVFVVPASEVMRLSDVENDNCLRATYTLDKSGAWTSDGMPLFAEDLRVGLRTLFKELINSSQEFDKPSSGANTASTGTGLLKRISELNEQSTNLAEKIVYQQEQIQNRIARDLHDGVIGDLLAVKRNFEAEYPQDTRFVPWLETIVERMRGICADLAPRDLQDWGLQTVVGDMVASIATRNNIDGRFHVSENLPELPQEVQLQIYRIIQECLINCEKHAKATVVEVRIELQRHIVVASIEDNGVGFNVNARDNRTAKQGGMGLDSIKERVQLIRCFFPAQVWINSVPGKGTRIVVQINSSGS